MQKEKLEILTAMAKVPGLKDLSILVENIPDAAEFDALNAEFQADMEATFAAEWELGFDEVHEIPARIDLAPLADHAVHGTKSQRTTIRIPGAVRAAFKARALAMGTRYQTLMIRELRAASERW